MSTIHEVAARAGVSVKTVSRVLNEPENVRENTRERVHDAMRALNYRPNEAARQLRGQTATNIGVLLGDPSSGYQSRVHQAMLAACLAAGSYLCVELFEGPSPGWEERVSVFIQQTRISGMVLLPPLCDFQPLKTLLRDLGVRVVAISPAMPDPVNPSVSMDDRAAASEIVGALIDLGHTRIGHVTGDPDHVAASLRRNGYVDAFITRGLARPPLELMVEGDFRFRKGRLAAEQLLAVKPAPTAVFAANDDTAAAVCMVAHGLGLRIPRDLSVVGFDDTPIASAIWPTLTTVRQPFTAMAESALKALALADAPGREPQRGRTYVERYELVFRESSGPPGKH
jgi:LacI family transcriptional regulator, galactose operon repressor